MPRTRASQRARVHKLFVALFLGLVMLLTVLIAAQMTH
jgi:hypothetical protein